MSAQNAMDRIGSQLHYTYRGPSWHGPTLVELLKDVTAEEAAQTAVPNVHSIWEIVLHAAAWKKAVQQRLEGKQVSLQGEEDWPSVVDTSYRAWADALAALDAAHASLEARLRNMTEADLDRKAPGQEDTTLYRTVHGVMEHDVYHAGQIALLKKALRGS
jgi:uncharacterized damage-inducible protein DinB